MRKFLIIGETNGCGANELALALASDPDAYVFGELLHPTPAAREKQAGRKAIGSYRADPLMLSHPVLYYDCTNVDVFVHNFYNLSLTKASALGFLVYEAQFASVKETIQRKRDIHVVYVPDNPLLSLIRQKRMVMPDNPVYLASAVCVKEFRSHQARLEAVRTAFAKHPLLITNMDTPLSEVATFLSINPRNAMPEPDRTPKDVLLNFEALKKRFATTPYVKYFAELDQSEAIENPDALPPPLMLL